jgi:hypothetical protein
MSYNHVIDELKILIKGLRNTNPPERVIILKRLRNALDVFCIKCGFYIPKNDRYKLLSNYYKDNNKELNMKICKCKSEENRIETDKEKLLFVRDIIIKALKKKAFIVKNQEIKDGVIGTKQNNLSFELSKVEKGDPLTIMITVFTIMKDLED